MKNNSCDCRVCQGACEHKPGWFAPDQIAPLADRLGITVEELFKKHLSVDWWCGDSLTDYDDVFVLSPKLAGTDGGDMFPGDPRGVCHWFKDGKCQVHALGKPAECAFTHHTMYKEEHTRRRKEFVKAWQEPVNQKMIDDLLGREPESEAFSGNGIMGLLGMFG